MNMPGSEFDINNFSSDDIFTVIGTGNTGGKASGLLSLYKQVCELDSVNSDIQIKIPRLTVIASDYFDEFMESNNLKESDFSLSKDHRIINRFLKAKLPDTLNSKLQRLVNVIRVPLAVRSSSFFEDSLETPFAGVYYTKMLPNNQFEESKRFMSLVDAVKLVYASVFLKESRDYIEGCDLDFRDEKMAVIIQDIAGAEQHDKLFYPDISGVARSYNYYPLAGGSAEQGVVNLALGMGKTVVDGSLCWSYSPAKPSAGLPFGSVTELLDNTQRDFWAVNLEKQSFYSPDDENEFMVKRDISSAEKNSSFRSIASTYDPMNDRVVPGIACEGPRVINFAPLLDIRIPDLNTKIDEIIKKVKQSMEIDAEIEFTFTFSKDKEERHKLDVLQIRPMKKPVSFPVIQESDLQGQDIILSTEHVLGNGVKTDIRDILFVKRDKFDFKDSYKIASEIGELNREFKKNNKKYLLWAYGRVGSSDPWLGIPVKWSDITNAAVIVEIFLDNMFIDLSQGSHFFHNLISQDIFYLSVPGKDSKKIIWDALDRFTGSLEKEYTFILSSNSPLSVIADSRNRRGVVKINE